MNLQKTLQASAFAAVFALTLAGAQVAQAAAQVDPQLGAFGRGQTQQRSLRVIALLEIDGTAMASPQRYNRLSVVNWLKQQTNRSYQKLQTYLASNPARSEVQFSKTFWINASVAFDVTPAGLRALAQAPGVSKIYANRAIAQDPPIRGGRNFTDDVPGTVPYDFVDTGLDQVIKQFPQVTGKGVTLGHIDTGVDAKHPALAGKIVSFYDPVVGKLVAPFDSDKDSNHGTHTAGTIVGGDRSGTLIGMAPDAKLISAAGLNSDIKHGVYDMELAAMQFMMDPNGDGNRSDAPKAVSNSWNCTGAPDMELFYRAISAWENAGILPIFSAGNSGRNGFKTITPPHEHPLTFAVGATGKDGKLADFSSKGPGTYQNKDTQKPDITAPGVDIRSTLANGKFGELSGTSMSTPHMTGFTALLLQINPRLTPAQIRALFVQTATPTNEDGSPGRAGVWNRSYGLGKVNILAAVKAASGVNHFMSERMQGLVDFNGMDWLSSPEDLMLRGIAELKSEFNINDYHAPEAWGSDGSTWLSAEDLL